MFIVHLTSGIFGSVGLVKYGSRTGALQIVVASRVKECRYSSPILENVYLLAETEQSSLLIFVASIVDMILTFSVFRSAF